MTEAQAAELIEAVYVVVAILGLISTGIWILVGKALAGKWD